MAFTSEAVARLRLDTNDFNRALTKTTVDFGKAGDDINKKLKRSFGAGDAFKGLMQGIGIGSVAAIGDLIARPFEIAYERAKAAVGLTSSLRDITTKEIVATSGHKTAIREMRREANDLGTDIETQGKLVAELNANPLNYISPVAFEIMRAAEQELNAMKVRQAEVQSQINITEKQRVSEQKEWVRNEILAQDLLEAELRDASELEKIQIRRNKNEKDYAAMKKRGDLGTSKDNAITGQAFALSRQQKLLQKEMAEQLPKTIVTIGNAAAKSPRTFANGQPRPRTEAERLADRAQQNIGRAESAVLLGNKGDAARFAGNAVRDLTKVGTKLGENSSSIPKGVADALPASSILKAFQTLDAIKKNLDPQTTTGKK